MILGKLNQTATWKQKTGQDAYSQPTFAADRTINVRWENKRRLVRNSKGQEVVSEARVFCIEAINPDDVFTFGGRDWPVIAVLEDPDLAGTVLYREVAC